MPQVQIDIGAITDRAVPMASVEVFFGRSSGIDLTARIIHRTPTIGIGRRLDTDRPSLPAEKLLNDVQGLNR